MRLLLMRHGQTHANVAGQLDTAHPGLELTGLGQRQAVAAERALAHRGVQGIWVSSRVRTHQTAAPSAGAWGSSPAQTAGLEEIAAGDLEMLADPASVQRYIHTVGSWISGDLGLRMPGGETGTQFLERYDAAIDAVASSGQETALVVSHGAAIRAWTATRVSTSRVSADPAAPLSNTALVVLEGDPRSGWELVEWIGTPVGSTHLEDPSADDPTGEALPTDE